MTSAPRRNSLILLLTVFAFLVGYAQQPLAQDKQATTVQPPIYIAFLWHMHQPIYYPGETILQTEASARFSFSVKNVHTDRVGPYTTWVRNAIDSLNKPEFGHGGAQVSFTGSLVENLNVLEAGGTTQFHGWKDPWRSAATRQTVRGNPRLDLVGFGYYHPLMGLISDGDIVRQIAKHRTMLQMAFDAPPSKGIFPPENAFSVRMIPALVKSGIEWVLVDNVHFDRACAGYPWGSGGSVVEPNQADVRNPDPGDWKQLSGLWMPLQASARWGRVPHWVAYTDPATGEEHRIVAVPGDRYLGNEDGRGGFGALQYEAVMSQLESTNTDPDHPILIVMPHDGDNHGGGSEAYYGSNFWNFLAWLRANPTRFICTTIQDYLEQFPPDTSDVIHVEDGSWLGADAGDPEFKKWNGDPGSGGISPDRASWSVITAAQNIVANAVQVDSGSPIADEAYNFLMMGEASDYWYWDGTEIWDSNPTVAANLAIARALPITIGYADQTPPTIYLPQREPYNPGGREWGIAQPSDFRVWTLVYDRSGVKRVTLFIRESSSSTVGPSNKTYEGGQGVGAWSGTLTEVASLPVSTNPQPLAQARMYSAVVQGHSDQLLDYYMEAEDSAGNVSRSPILHVYVGASGGGGGNAVVSWIPAAPTRNDTIVISVRSTKGGWLHWGVNQWTMPHATYWPAGSTAWFDNKAIESPFATPDTAGVMRIHVGPFNNAAQTPNQIAFVIHFADNSWDNNGGSDYFIPLSVTGIESGAVPMRTELEQNYPNPFNPMTNVDYRLSIGGPVKITVFDLLGREVAVLVNEEQPAGRYGVRWDASGQPSGVYHVSLVAGTVREIKRMMLIR